MPLDTPPIYFLFCLGEMPMLRSAALPAAMWQCQRCGHTQNAYNNKRRCFSCRAWRDRIAPLTFFSIAIANKEAGGGQPWQFFMTGDVPMQVGAQGRNDHITQHPDAIILMDPWPHIDKVVPAGTTIAKEPLLSVESCRFIDENDAPNSASPCKGDCPKKRGGKRKSPS
jgi:hypothetical protein